MAAAEGRGSGGRGDGVEGVTSAFGILHPRARAFSFFPLPRPHEPLSHPSPQRECANSFWVVACCAICSASPSQSAVREGLV